MSQATVEFASKHRGGGPLAVEGVAAQTMKMFYGKNIETALHALSITLVPRELLDVCLQTRQSLCDMPAGSLFVCLSRAKRTRIRMCGGDR
jgi:hypothetical protein